jgi:hypothetical protein
MIFGSGSNNYVTATQIACSNSLIPPLPPGMYVNCFLLLSRHGLASSIVERLDPYLYLQQLG